MGTRICIRSTQVLDGAEPVLRRWLRAIGSALAHMMPTHWVPHWHQVSAPLDEPRDLMNEFKQSWPGLIRSKL